jgi:hypothetical protein
MAAFEIGWKVWLHPDDYEWEFDPGYGSHARNALAGMEKDVLATGHPIRLWITPDGESIMAELI